MATGSEDERVCAYAALAITVTHWLYFMVHEIVTVGGSFAKAGFLLRRMGECVGVWDIAQLASLGTVAAASDTLETVVTGNR